MWVGRARETINQVEMASALFENENQSHQLYTHPQGRLGYSN